MGKCLTPWELERYDSGELAVTEAQNVREHLDSCASCREAHSRYRDDRTLEQPSRPTRSDATQSISPGTQRTAPSAPQRAETRFPSIEGYQITGVLGQGGMGVVYRAVQTALNRTVALKVLPAMVGSASSAAVSRFRREATSAARLHHTHIIPVYDFGESRDGYYYAMELITGKPLDVLIRQFGEQNAASASLVRLGQMLWTTVPEAVGMTSVDGSASLSGGDLSTSGSPVSTGRGTKYYHLVARWMADTADALYYAHEQGIIHRDIKPANLILSVDGRIMLADFGLAKSAESESVTQTGALVGTLRYMSPEQSMARRVRLDHRTDIYSLGATMYELLCFEPAFTGDDQKAILGAIISREPTRPRKNAPACPPELETICLKCMEKSPEARYPTGKELADDLLRFINDLPIAAKRPGPVQRTVKLIRRHKAASAAIAASVLLCAVVGVAFHINDRRMEAEAEKRLAQIETLEEQHRAKEAQAQELIADGVRIHQQLTRTPAATRRKLLQASGFYEKALEIIPFHWRALANLARAKRDLFNVEADPDPALLNEAFDLCTQALEAKPELADLWNLKGVLSKKLGRYEDALAAYRKATEIEPDQVAWWDNVGTVQALMHDFDAARKTYARAVELAGVEDPCNVHAWRNLAALQLFRGDPEGAASLDQAIACGPGDVWTVVLQARCRLQKGDAYDPARALFGMETAEKSASHGEPHVQRILALAYLHNGDYEQAVEHARIAIKEHGMSTINHLIIALAQAKRHEIDESRTALVKALADWPNDLLRPTDFQASAPAGALWFDGADELFRLRGEVQELLGSAAHSP